MTQKTIHDGTLILDEARTQGMTISLTTIFCLSLLLIGCERPDPKVTVISQSDTTLIAPTPIIANNNVPVTSGSTAQTLPNLPTYVGTPTPDPVLGGQTAAGGTAVHVVNAGETLGYIAQLYGTSLETILETNQLDDAQLIYVGQELLVPQQSALVGSSFKLIPDSELVLGPLVIGFNIREVATFFGGYLLTYEQTVEGQTLAGPEIVDLVAQRHSVNPRLLLALLEYKSGWLTQVSPVETVFSLGYANNNAANLYQQLSWAANLLNLGFYGRSEGGRRTLATADGTQLTFAQGINDGTAGVQTMLAASSDYNRWLTDVGPNGFFATYNRLFGNPFGYSYDPLWPSNLSQPPLQLPWPSGDTWYLTSGPHGGWNTGSAWAAIDFVPTGEQLGCGQSDAWVTAMADGVVVRSSFGAVVVDSDGDGFVGTGWAITYMHLETRDRIPVGTVVQAGDRLGHPSCEGGFSNATHVHLSRTYNGRWVSADGTIPFNMGGWVAQGSGSEYDGWLVRGEIIKEACQCWEEINAITRE
ncbi:MAG: LysM peptidoglycan-binding domain-containing protein [Chloroflexota bacterium]